MKTVITADVFDPDYGDPVARLYAQTRAQVEHQIEAEGLQGWTIRWGTAEVIANPQDWKLQEIVDGSGSYRAYSPALDCEGMVRVRSSTLGAKIVRSAPVELLDGRIAIL
jgi:hypothetical protein